MDSKISRIIFTTDTLREPHNKIKSGAINKNCLWFNTLFGSLIKEVSELPLIFYDFENLNDFTKELYSIYGFNEPLKEMNWLEIYNQTEIKEEALELFKKYFANSLVFGFELPQIFRRYFNEIGVIFIDIIHHPIRYLDDLMHGFSTNNKELYLKLMEHQVNPDIFKLVATYSKTKTVMRNNNANIIPNSCVIFGQTRVDRSILKKDNSLANMLDYKDEIINLSKKYSHIYFKPHPANKDNEEVLTWFKNNIENFSLLQNIYTYDLYSNPNIALYASLSSGTLYEAKYFGNNIKYFYKQPFLYGEDFINKSIEEYNFEEVFVSLNKVYLTFEFWSNILSCIIETKEKQHVKNLNLDNTLRYALGAAWGYYDNHYLSVESKIKGLESTFTNSLHNFKNKIQLKIWEFIKKNFIDMPYDIPLTKYEEKFKFLKFEEVKQEPPISQLTPQEQIKLLQDKINNLEINYQKALNTKNHLSYKLGAALIKANKNWYKGGYIKFIFEVIRINKEYKNI